MKVGDLVNLVGKFRNPRHGVGLVINFSGRSPIIRWSNGEVGSYCTDFIKILSESKIKFE